MLVCSRGRAAILSRLIDDVVGAFLPALEAGGVTATLFVYAQLYPDAFLDELQARHAPAIASERLVIVTSRRPHTRIGDVVATAIRETNARMAYRLVMLVDDDSLYTPDPRVEDNLRSAVGSFLERRDQCYSVKLGSRTDLAFEPFLDPDGPIAPFKEKMIWASRDVLDSVLALPRFDELSIAEDTVITALAWKSDPERCRAVHGIGTFVHFGAEAVPDQPHGEVPGGYADLVGFSGPPTEAAPQGKYDAALREGVTHWHVMPDVFVGPEHPHFIYAGIRADLARRLCGQPEPEDAKTPR
jgi:hypothetical protein